MRHANWTAGSKALIWVLGLLTALRAAGPTTVTADWNNLRTVTPGEQIQIVLNDAKSYQGKF